MLKNVEERMLKNECSTVGRSGAGFGGEELRGRLEAEDGCLGAQHMLHPHLHGGFSRVFSFEEA